ncbi:hypothetical protein CC80DRAFT_540309 [Byssothecium circinans]|uniref:Uncharacterized protein n=1 Tax=Byssothecium circinans TaxID=147558 RepID=A0A6A5TKJ5_9PLEO|nr:hypothetical protein CC80DRAFT_540309 [Byssothecium circinans]
MGRKRGIMQSERDIWNFKWNADSDMRFEVGEETLRAVASSGLACLGKYCHYQIPPNIQHSDGTYMVERNASGTASYVYLAFHSTSTQSGNSLPSISAESFIIHHGSSRSIGTPLQPQNQLSHPDHVREELDSPGDHLLSAVTVDPLTELFGTFVTVSNSPNSPS